MTEHRSFFGERLAQAATSIAFGFSEQLAQLRPHAFVLEAACSVFDLSEYAASDECTAVLADHVHNQLVTRWHRPGNQDDEPNAAWYQVSWRGHDLEVVVASWKEGWGAVTWQWIIAGDERLAREFFDAGCEYCHEVRDEVLVFSDGCWAKSQRLFEAVQGTRLDSLVLRGDLAADIARDCEQFFSSRGLYERYRIPWKRGVLLLGPPGNGKTHCVKGLINALAQPCLYVQSFNAQYSTDQANIDAVFSRARRTAPCVLVLEDLDSLLNDDNRSFFLNELDGFESNQGILTIATTNYPERLDPAIVDRPSRFDLKYTFDLPQSAERREYLSRWNAGLSTELHLSADELADLAERCDGFSFAYLKELCVSSLMRWFHERDRAFAEVLDEQLTKLRGQTAATQAPVKRGIDRALMRLGPWIARARNGKS